LIAHLVIINTEGLELSARIIASLIKADANYRVIFAVEIGAVTTGFIPSDTKLQRH